MLLVWVRSTELFQRGRLVTSEATFTQKQYCPQNTSDTVNKYSITFSSHINTKWFIQVLVWLIASTYHFRTDRCVLRCQMPQSVFVSFVSCYQVFMYKYSCLGIIHLLPSSSFARMLLHTVHVHMWAFQEVAGVKLELILYTNMHPLVADLSV